MATTVTGTLDPTLVRQAASRGITRKTMQHLFDSGFGDREKLADISEKDLKDLSIPAAQKFRIRKLMEELLITRYEQESIEAQKAALQALENKEGTADEAASAENGPSDGTTEEIELSNKETEKEEGTLDINNTALDKMLKPNEESKPDGTSFLRFLYSNLLTMESHYNSNKPECTAHVHHLGFITSKLVQQFPVAKVLDYDHQLRSQVEKIPPKMKWQDRLIIDPKDELVAGIFCEDQLEHWHWKKANKAHKQIPDAFNTSRCLRWNYTKDPSQRLCDDSCIYAHVCLCCGEPDHVLTQCLTNMSKKKGAAKDAVKSRYTQKVKHH